MEGVSSHWNNLNIFFFFFFLNDRNLLLHTKLIQQQQDRENLLWNRGRASIQSPQKQVKYLPLAIQEIGEKKQRKTGNATPKIESWVPNYKISIVSLFD